MSTEMISKYYRMNDEESRRTQNLIDSLQQIFDTNDGTAKEFSASVIECFFNHKNGPLIIEGIFIALTSIICSKMDYDPMMVIRYINDCLPHHLFVHPKI